jgi:hypothetical protein
MARDESKRNLGQPARDALSGLGAMLAEMSAALKSNRQPGEFTRQDAMAELGVGRSATQMRLAALVESGALVSREGRENSKVVTFYRRP